VYQSLKTAVVLRQLLQVHMDIHTVIFHCSSLVSAQICCFCIQASWCHSWIMFLIGLEVATVDISSGHRHHLCCHFGNSVPMVHLPVCTAVFSIPCQYSSDCFTLSDHKNQVTVCFSIMILSQNSVYLYTEWATLNITAVWWHAKIWLCQGMLYKHCIPLFISLSTAAVTVSLYDIGNLHLPWI